jgi:hypothetical protein
MSDLEQLKKNLVYKLKAQDIGLASWKGSHGRPEKMFIPTKDYLLSSATKQQDAIQKRNEMMEEYLDEQRTPIIGYDADGDPIEYKFHAIDPPELTYNNVISRIKTTKGLEEITIEPEKFKEFLDDLPNIGQRVSEEFLNRIDELDQDYTNNKIDLEDFKLNFIKDNKERLEREYNDENLDIERNVDLTDRTRKRQKYRLQAKFKEDLRNLKDQYKDGINQFSRILKLIKDDISQLNNDIYESDANLMELAAKVRNEQKKNEGKVKAYQEELNALNSGQLNTSKGIDETDEQYLARLQQMADIPFADGRTEERALIRLKNKLRENLKLIVRSNSVIDQVVNDIYSNAPGSLNDINKYFPGFKDYFIKKFGENNDKITGNDIVTEIKFYLEKASNPDIMRGILPTSQEVIVRDQNRPFLPALSTEQLSASNPIDIPGVRQLTNPNSPRSESDEGEYEEVEFGTPIEKLEETISAIVGESNQIDRQLLDGNTTLMLRKSPKKIYIKMVDSVDAYNTQTLEGERVKVPARRHPMIFYSLSGQADTFKQIKGTDIYKLISQVLEVPLQLIKDFLGVKKATAITLENIVSKFKLLGLRFTTKKPEEIEEIDDQKNIPLLGLGVKNSEDIPEKVKFGSNILLLKKLFLKNILSIQNKHNVKINGFNNVHVSDNFVKIIMNLIKNINFTNNDLQNLSGNERLLLDNLLMLSELNKQFVTGSSTDSLNKIKKDYEILIGEIQAGNNNDLLKKKLYHLLMKLVHFRALGFPTAIKHYKEIIKEYF